MNSSYIDAFLLLFTSAKFYCYFLKIFIWVFLNNLTFGWNKSCNKNWTILSIGYIINLWFLNIFRGKSLCVFFCFNGFCLMMYVIFNFKWMLSCLKFVCLICIFYIGLITENIWSQDLFFFWLECLI